jgi:hypothetical protein
MLLVAYRAHGWRWPLNNRSTATDELQNEHHQRDQKQNVDVCTQNVEANEPQ